jgi:hypothetical protein
MRERERESPSIEEDVYKRKNSTRSRTSKKKNKNLQSLRHQEDFNRDLLEEEFKETKS